MHHLNSNEMHGKKARWEQHKNAMLYFEEILEGTLIKQQLYGHLPPILQTIQVR